MQFFYVRDDKSTSQAALTYNWQYSPLRQYSADEDELFCSLLPASPAPPVSAAALASRSTNSLTPSPALRH